MKRAIDGAVYDTDTSTKLGRFEYEMCNRRQAFPCNDTLYQTRGGAFFVVGELEMDLGDGGDRATSILYEVIGDWDAQEWISSGEVEIFHNPFDDPRQAVA